MNIESKTLRQIEEVIEAQPASDGVNLKRVFGGGDLSRFDPFLMLDEFGSDEAADYIGGFPPHPHRGFETVTYMLEGKMEHRDHMGNVGLLNSGDVQWMKAGSGVIHSEMPKQEEGRMRGFQLWVNLPGAEKMTPATYNDIDGETVPNYQIGEVSIKSIAGELSSQNHSLSGAVSGLSTDPGYLDLAFKKDDELEIEVPSAYTSLIYVYEGSAFIGEGNKPITKGNLARLSRDGLLRIKANADSRVLVMTGKPIGEPIVQRGPFVMNSADEIHQAIRDYSEGVLVEGNLTL